MNYELLKRSRTMAHDDDASPAAKCTRHQNWRLVTCGGAAGQVEPEEHRQYSDSVRHSLSVPVKCMF